MTVLSTICHLTVYLYLHCFGCSLHLHCFAISRSSTKLDYIPVQHSIFEALHNIVWKKGIIKLIDRPWICINFSFCSSFFKRRVISIYMLLGTVEKIQPINLAIKNLHFGYGFFYYVIEPLLHELNLHNQAMMHFLCGNNAHIWYPYLFILHGLMNSELIMEIFFDK